VLSLLQEFSVTHTWCYKDYLNWQQKNPDLVMKLRWSMMTFGNFNANKTCVSVCLQSAINMHTRSLFLRPFVRQEKLHITQLRHHPENTAHYGQAGWHEPQGIQS
jgi:hypothetical protein